LRPFPRKRAPKEVKRRFVAQSTDSSRKIYLPAASWRYWNDLFSGSLDNHKRAKAFFQWVAWLEDDLPALLATTEQKKKRNLIEAHFGPRIAAAIIPLSSVNKDANLIVTSHTQGPLIISQPSKPWRG
jgi:hypothetical protein